MPPGRDLGEEPAGVGRPVGHGYEEALSRAPGGMMPRVTGQPLGIAEAVGDFLDGAVAPDPGPP